MSELEPLLKSATAPAHVKRLLRAGQLDADSASQRNQARIAAAALLHTSAVPPKTLGLGRSLAYVGAGAATVGLVGLFVLGGHSAQTTALSTARITRTTPAAATAAPPGEALGIAVDELPLVAPPAGHSAPRAATVVATPVVDELSRLDEVRRKLAAGEPTRARDELIRYRADHPQGRYGVEADALEVQVLAATGRRDEARALASRFLREHPGSPHAERLRRFLESTP